jgi:hypothetical protein
MREVSFASAESLALHYSNKHYRNLVLEIDISRIYILIGFIRSASIFPWFLLFVVVVVFDKNSRVTITLSVIER